MDVWETSAQRWYRKPGDGMNLHGSEGRKGRTNSFDIEELGREDPAEERAKGGSPREEKSGSLEAERRKRDRRKVRSADHVLPGGGFSNMAATAACSSSACPSPAPASFLLPVLQAPWDLSQQL